MGSPAVNPACAELDDFIDAFERAQVADGHADPADFLPPADHPHYLTVLRELVRVDLEYGWQRGRPRSLDEYQSSFPQLFLHGPSLRDVAFEEYRLRGQAGQPVYPAEYQQRFGIDVSDWPVQGETVPLEAASRGSDLLRQAGGAASDSELARAAQSFRAFLRCHGEAGGDLDAWLADFAGNADHARVFRDLQQADPRSAERLAEAVTALPAPGDTFQGFQLIEELGRGAFGRVFLARQGDLADRPVALKVSTDLWIESQALAQLQHTHIVPIYSVHRGGPLQAVCMPYLGATTLADVLRELPEHRPDSAKGLLTTLASRRRSTVAHQAHRSPAPSASEGKPGNSVPPRSRSGLVDRDEREEMTYVDAVLSLAARLADGLAHAHERGILHRDLKPANVLLADDGRPMLLDFNLSEDTKLRGYASAARVGGTLPYMAPEQLDAFDQGRGGADARGDVYSLGVILYELLTGRLPFAAPRGPLPEVLAAMRKDRRQAPPRLRHLNPRVSPAVESIVRHCLEPNPGRRYASARDLEEDLRRQLDNRPLRHVREPSVRERLGKLVRRHPRLTAGAAVAAVAGVLVLALGAALAVNEVRLARVEARNAVMSAAAEREQFRHEMRAAQVHFLSGPDQFERGRDRTVRALERYQVMKNPSWCDQPTVVLLAPAEQEGLREEIVELLLLWARATVERDPAGGRLAEALKLNEQAESCWGDRPLPRAVYQQRAGLYDLSGEPEKAARLRALAADCPAERPCDLAMLASEYALAGRLHEALPLLHQAVRDDPRRCTLAFDLAACYDRLDRAADAVAWYGTSIALSPELGPLYFRRGVAYQRLRSYAQALADFEKAGQLDSRLAADCLLGQAVARIGMKRYSEAIRDLDAAEKRGASPVRVCLMRARARQALGDVEGARRDRERGLAEKPGDAASWLARGSAQLADNPRAALDDFNQVLRFAPRSLPALQNKAHVLAERLQRGDEALRTMDELVAAFPDYAPGWAGRAVLRARAGDRAGAHADARTARALDAQPSILYQLAGAYALTSRQNAEDRRTALHLLAAALGKGHGLDQLDRDADLDPLRDSPEFGRLVESARNLRAK